MGDWAAGVGHAAGVLLVFTLNHIQIARGWLLLLQHQQLALEQSRVRLDNSFKLQITTACPQSLLLSPLGL